MKYTTFRSYKGLVFLALLLCFGGCKVQEKSTTNSDDMELVSIPKIAFLNYSIVKDSSSGSYELSFISKVIAEGKIKSDSPTLLKPRENDLEYLVFDKDSEVILANYIRNPLHRTIEYVNDDGLLAMKEIGLDSAQFSLRIQLDPAATSIAIALYRGEGKNNIQLSLIDLLKGEEK